MTGPQQPQTQTQAPDTLPADFFTQPQAATQNSAPDNQGPQPQAAPDTLPAGFFSNQPAQAAPSTALDPGARFSGGTGTISAIPQPTSYLGKFAQWTENVSRDLQDGGDRTGVGTVLKKLGAHGLHTGNSEAVGDFMGSLPLGLLKATKGGTELAPHVVGGPQGKTWQGIKDLVGGGLQAATMPAAFVAPEESALSEEGLLNDAASTVGKTGEATASGIRKVANAVTAPFRESAAQPELQSGIRKVAGAVAKEADVAAPKSPSIYKTVEEAADNVYSKSKAQYAELDEATNGRVQRFRDRLNNIRDQMNSLTGTEEDAQKEASLLKAQKETEEGMQDAFNDAKAKGVDPKLIDEASANFKQSQALYDLDTALQRSTSGKPLGAGTTKGLPETVDPKKLAPRITALWKSGRLQQAIGSDNTADLIDFVGNAAKQQQSAIRNKLLLKIAGIGVGGPVVLHKGAELLAGQ